MPTRNGMKVPPPNSAEEFERITTSAVKLRWNVTEVTRYGRSGQDQEGVDIFIVTNNGEVFGIQCRNVKNLSTDELKTAVTDAERFRPMLAHFFFATTAPRDAKVQEVVRLMTVERAKKKRFQVSLLYWDDIINDLLSDERQFRKFYPELAQPVLEPRYNGLLFEEMIERVRAAQLPSCKQAPSTGKPMDLTASMLFFEARLLSGELLMPVVDPSGGPECRPYQHFLTEHVLPEMQKLGLADRPKNQSHGQLMGLPLSYELTTAGREFLLRLRIEFEKTRPPSPNNEPPKS